MCAATFAVSGCSLLPDEPEEEVLPEIKPPVISQKPTYEVRLETIETRVSANGRIMSTREEDVFFTEDDKRLKELYVRPGDMVEAGQVVAELDVSDLEKMLRERRLQFRRDEVEMKMKLRDRDQMDPIQFEEAKIAFEQKLQEIEELEQTIANAKLTAPFAGTVVTLHVEKGALVKAYDPILTIADVDDLAVAVSLTKDDLNKVAPGMEAVVSIGTIGTYTGKVKQLPVASGDDQGGGGIPQEGESDSLEKYLIVELDEFPKEATRGMPLNVSIITQRKENCVVIPLAALRTIGSRTYVQVMEEDGTKREVDVEIGQQTSTDVEIVKGLQPGQKVVGR
jgi:macrolide-specific efflux system membrane fusion protein